MSCAAEGKDCSGVDSDGDADMDGNNGFIGPKQPGQQGRGGDANKKTGLSLTEESIYSVNEAALDKGFGGADPEVVYKGGSNTVLNAESADAQATRAAARERGEP